MAQQQEQQAPKLKSFEVYHIESTEFDSERYYNGTIEAISTDQAIEIFKKEWIKEEYQDNVHVESVDKDGSDMDVIMINTGTEYFINGNEATDQDIEELENKHDCDLSWLIDGNIEGVEIGWMDHYYELIETENLDHEYDDLNTKIQIIDKLMKLYPIVNNKEID